MSIPDHPRFMVDNGMGKQYRGNGFRRAEKVSTRRGNWIVAHMPAIEAIARAEAQASPTGRIKRGVWWWVREPFSRIEEVVRKEIEGE